MALFLSTFVNRVDAKGRVSVPASFRAALNGQSFAGIVVFPALSLATLEGSGIDRMAALSARVDALPEFSEEREAISAIFADAQQLPFDSEGRVMLPSWLAEHAGITESAAFVGSGNVFHIWEPGRYQEHQTQRRAQARGITLPTRPAEPGSAR